MSNRYAERTRVTAAKSRADIEAELSKHDCDKIAVMSSATEIVFAFIKDAIQYKTGIDFPADDAREKKRRLRTLFAYIKARLNAVEDGLVTFEQEFVGEVVTANGHTIREQALEQVQSSANLPTVLMLENLTEGR